MDFEEEITDRWGAQLSQECPLPANHQPMGTNNRTEQCRCLQCGRLFRLDLAGQVVSGTAKSFHGGGDLLRPAGEASFGAANVRSRKHHDLVSIPGNKMGILQRGNLVRHFFARSAPRLSLDSISARQKRRTSAVFRTDLPSSLSKSTGRRLSTWPNSCNKASV